MILLAQAAFYYMAAASVASAILPADIYQWLKKRKPWSVWSRLVMWLRRSSPSKSSLFTNLKVIFQVTDKVAFVG